MKLTERKRADILEAAITEFREQGLVAGRINRIAEMANVSKRTLYKHFETKDALFDAILEIVMAEIASIAPASFNPDHDLDAQLVSALDAYIDVISSDNFVSLNRLVTSEYLRNQDLTRKIFTRTEMHNEPVTGLISQAMEQGRLKPADPKYAATQLLSHIKTFFFWPKFLIGEDVDFGKTKEEILSDCVAMFLTHYRI